MIQTCNRPLELERAIEYWRDTPVTVHIVDGSEKPWFPLGVLPQAPNITYHSFTPFIDEHQFENHARRMQFASSIPVTKFSALCADDDFYTISGLAKFCSLMYSNQNVDAVVGICSDFKLSDDNSETRWDLRYADWKAGAHSLSDDVSLRVLGNSGNFYSYYALMRTELWKKTVSCAFQMVDKEGYFYEHFMNLFSMAHCRTIVERHIFWIKTAWVPNPNIPLLANRPREADWFRDKKNRDQVKLFERQLRSVFASIIQGPNRNRTASYMAKKIRQRISRKSNSRKYRKIKGVVLKFFVRVLDFLPSHTKLFVKQFLTKNLLVATGSNREMYQNLRTNNFLMLPEFLLRLAETDITFDSKDFDSISNLLLKPREELRLHANL